MLFFGRALFFMLLTMTTGLVTAKRIEVKRQTTAVPNVPSSCASLCSVFNTLQANTDPSQLCTSANSAAVQSCSNCILLIDGDAVLNNDSLLSGAQRAANAFVAACNAASHTIPAILVSNPLTQSTAAAPTTTGTQSSHNSAYIRADLRSVSTIMAAGFLSTIISFI